MIYTALVICLELRNYLVVSYPDPQPQLRMDYITATRKEGLEKLLTYTFCDQWAVLN